MTVSSGLFMHNHPTSVALGVFDGMHLGHMAVISGIVDSSADTIPVVMTFTGAPKHGGRLMTGSMKARVLRDFGVQELITVPFESIRDMEPEEFVRKILKETLSAQRISCGFNFRFGKNAAGDAQILRQLGEACNIEVKICGSVNDSAGAVSSTRIRSLIAQGDVKAAMMLLGRPFGYDYEVVGGQQRGRLMGTPTLNQHFEPDFCVPRFGVYASVVRHGGKLLPAVTNVGVRPTVGADFPLSETWIPDFSADLYGENVETYLLDFMRGEEKFPSMEELRQAILRDAECSRKIAGEFCSGVC